MPPKSEKPQVEKDAPALPVDENPPTTTAPVPAQAQPMDETLNATTPEPSDDPVGGVFTITLDMEGVPRAGEYEVLAGHHDPSLVVIPGLGQFRNGTTQRVEGVRLMHMAVHFGVDPSNLKDVQLPEGVTIKKEGK
jgi:hypothetical protein